MGSNPVLTAKHQINKMKLREWIQYIGKRDHLKNGQGIAVGGGIYGKYYESIPLRKNVLPPPPALPSNLDKKIK